MKVIIAGSRDGIKKEGVITILRNSPFRITEVVCGEARGVDTYGKEWAIESNIKVTSFPADWKTHGKKAGYLRNEEMAKYADVLIAIWDGESKGTKHMIDLAIKHGLQILLINTSTL